MDPLIDTISGLQEILNNFNYNLYTPDELNMLRYQINQRYLMILNYSEHFNPSYRALVHHTLKVLTAPN